MYVEKEMEHTASDVLGSGAGSSGDQSGLSGFGSNLNYTPTTWSEIDDSTESTRSDEEGDDFIDELTRQMAENMLQEDEDEHEKDSSINSKKPFDLGCNKHTSRYCNGQAIMSNSKSQTPTSVLPNPTTHFYSNQSQSQTEQRGYHFGHESRGSGFVNAFQAGSGMRVVFLGGAGSRTSGSPGTGVFLPHATNTAAAELPNSQTRKRAVCSTVLIPERVLQTLKHHFEKRAAQMQSNGGLHTQQNQRLRSRERTPTNMNNQELQLPQEWTY